MSNFVLVDKFEVPLGEWSTRGTKVTLSVDQPDVAKLLLKIKKHNDFGASPYVRQEGRVDMARFEVIYELTFHFMDRGKALLFKLTYGGAA